MSKCPALPVYAFSGATYMNYNGATNVSGQVTLTLPLGNCRFRADKGSVQWIILWLVMCVPMSSS